MTRLAVLLLAVSVAPAQVDATPEIAGADTVAYLAEFKAKGIPNSTAILWSVNPKPPGLTMRRVPNERVMLVAGPPGEYEITMTMFSGKVDAKGSLEIILELGEVTKKFRITGTPGPTPPVPPGPTPPVPPGPTPPTPPQPPTPDPPPIPAEGLHVLIVFESGELDRYPSGQVQAMTARTVRDYLARKCPKGPDGKTPQWRMWDKDTDVTGESQLWRLAFARKRDKLPWIVVSNGKEGFEGPLPASADEMLKLLKKYGGE